jgi:hypothetical protein
LFKENENVKKNSRFVQRFNENKSIKLRKGGSPAAAGPGDISPDNRAGDSNADNIKWDGRKPRSSYIYRTYSEEKNPHIKVYSSDKESNFSKDKDKLNKKRWTNSPTVSQRMRNVDGVGPQYDTRQQGTVYPMSGLGDVTYREQRDFRSFRNKVLEAIDDPGANDMGVGGTLGGASNKEPMQNPKDNIGVTIEKKKKKK